MSAKIIQFPLSKRVLDFKTKEELNEHVIELKKEQLFYIIEDCIGFIKSRYWDDGLETDDPKCNTMFNFIGEAIGAVGYKAWNIHHPLHDFADSNFSEKPEPKNEGDKL